MWAGASAGVVRVLPGGHFRMLTREQGLIDRQINAVAFDRARNMWAGTEAAGVMQIRTRGITTFREQDGLKTDRVWTILSRRNGELVVVTNDPSSAAWVHFFDGQRFHSLSMEPFTRHPSWGHHILLEARDGAWWAATSSGFCRYAAGETSALAGRQPEACYRRG
jgi:ligand-binding sensor domain-containing protein